MRLVKHRNYWAVRLEDGRRVSLRTADIGEAEQRLEDLKRSAVRKKETIGQVVDAYLKEKKEKPSIRGMKDAWKAAESFFGNMRPDQMSRQLCREYAIKRKVSAGTVRKELGIIRQALKWHDPKTVPEIELPTAPPPKERFLTKDEARRLEDACTTPHLKLFVQLALKTAARRGALLDLTWSQVDLKRAEITLSKGVQTSKGRATVPINETLLDALKTAKKDSLSPYVITYAGQRVKSVNKGFREACERAGLKGVTPHTLRHTAATWMVQAGRPMHDVAAYLGHTNIQTTYRTYSKFTAEHLRASADALDY
ncbi:MAG: site-specific integrase [bacterium]|nr:site-specific integrase [bacterium]